MGFMQEQGYKNCALVFSIVALILGSLFYLIVAPMSDLLNLLKTKLKSVIKK